MFSCISYEPLWETLRSRNINMKEMQKRTGITKETLSELKKNKAITLETLHQICDGLGCTVSDVVEINCEMFHI